jgi:esterase/lipase superfamily enzyme
MQREYRKWKSPSLGREMEMLVFGTGGTPVLIFPSDHGRFHEWEDQGIMGEVQEQIENGYNQFFCVDSVAIESYLNKDVDPFVRLMRENQFQMYIMDEVLPLISEENSNPYLISAGVGLGAYQALIFALKYPYSFNRLISISGYYDINAYLDGFKDENSYYNNPIEFMPNLNNSSLLKAISSVDIRLISYLNDPNRDQSLKMSDILWLKGIEHKHTVLHEEVDNIWSMLPSSFKANLL